MSAYVGSVNVDGYIRFFASDGPTLDPLEVDFRFVPSVSVFYTSPGEIRPSDVPLILDIVYQ
jgi:hypothetical protein